MLTEIVIKYKLSGPGEIARNRDELEIVVDEANSILDVNKVVASILLVEDLRIQKD